VLPSVMGEPGGVFFRARRVVSAWLSSAVVHIASAVGVVPFSRVLKWVRLSPATFAPMAAQHHQSLERATGDRLAHSSGIPALRNPTK
jgi:hypothetical protein